MTSSSRPRAEATPGWTVSLQALEKGIRDRARKENSSGLWMCRPGTDHREKERQRERERERERVMGQRSNEREIFFPWSLLDRGININGIGAWLWRCRTLWLEGNNDEHDARDSRSSTQQQIYALYYANARTHARPARCEFFVSDDYVIARVIVCVSMHVWRLLVRVLSHCTYTRPRSTRGS